MATDDCTVLVEKPCPCGKGTVKVQDCMPDHPWARASQRFLKSKLECDECRNVYVLEDRGTFDLGPIVLVERSLVVEREKVLTHWHKTKEEIWESTKAKVLIQSFINFLDDQPSMVAMYRILTKHKFYVSSLPNFRKSVKGPGGIASFVRSNFDASSLLNMMAALEVSDSEIEKQLENLKDMWNAANAPLRIIGKPIVEAMKK